KLTKTNENQKQMRTPKAKYITAMLKAIAGFALQQAKGNLFTSFITTPNAPISPFSGTYATDDRNLTPSTTGSVTFTSTVVESNIYLFGGVNAVDLNVNASSFAVGTITGSNAGSGFTPGPLSNDGSGNVDGLGIFNLTIRSFDGFTHSSDTVTFDLTNTGGTWASASDVLAFNSSGFDAAMHVFVTSSPANADNGAIATGFAGEGPQGHVPDGGATAMFMGLGLSALSVVRRFLIG